MKRVMLISNEVMHYRVSVYNYFQSRFREQGFEWIVRADKLQKENPYDIRFDLKTIPFRFSLYREEINRTRPDVVILFLHLKDLIIFPLVYWLKFKNIPVLLWTKGANLDAPNDILSKAVYHHLHTVSDGLILYSRNELPLLKKRNHHKVTYANNTINYHEFPNIELSKEDIKGEYNIKFKKVALFAGRMDVGGGRKKVSHAIKIFKAIDNPDYGLVLVGSGFKDELKNEMNEKNTTYLGEVHDGKNMKISKIFKMADIFLIPGHVGLGINQAFYWGLPVVTEKGPQPPEIHYLINGRNGYIVEENDLEGLRTKVLYLLENDQERIRLGENAKKDILENASIEGMFNGFLQNIQRVLR
jgi:glycosyltransferase involved in cell wall biosynthesis